MRCRSRRPKELARRRQCAISSLVELDGRVALAEIEVVARVLLPVQLGSPAEPKDPPTMRPGCFPHQEPNLAHKVAWHSAVFDEVSVKLLFMTRNSARSGIVSRVLDITRSRETERMRATGAACSTLIGNENDSNAWGGGRSCAAKHERAARNPRRLDRAAGRG